MFWKFVKVRVSDIHGVSELKNNLVSQCVVENYMSQTK